MPQTTLDEVVDLVSTGDEVYLGGFGYNQPFAVAHELIRRGVGDLRVVRASGDVLLDQLVGAGLVEETVTAHCWNAIGPTPTHAFRRAVEDGDPRPLAVEEFGLGDLLLRFFAGARRLPFVPAGPAPGTGQFEHRVHEEKYTPVEFDGETHHVVRPMNPSIGFVHVHRADERGNAQLRGPKAELRHAALACETLIVTAEEVVPAGDLRETPELTTVPGFHVDGVVEVPGGSHPSGVAGYYERDVPYLEYYGETTETAASFEAYLDEWVYGVPDRAAYLERVEREGFGEVVA
ncbi:MAG: CoA transferase subunit A [Haloarculaceae archaeon]